MNPIHVDMAPPDASSAPNENLGREDEMLTTKTVAQRANVCDETVRRLAKNGGLPAVKIGRQWRFPRSSVDQMLGGDVR